MEMFQGLVDSLAAPLDVWDEEEEKEESAVHSTAPDVARDASAGRPLCDGQYWVSIKVPEGVRPGEMIAFHAPDGRLMHSVVPEGATAGTSFDCMYTHKAHLPDATPPSDQRTRAREALGSEDCIDSDSAVRAAGPCAASTWSEHDLPSPSASAASPRTPRQSAAVWGATETSVPPLQEVRPAPEAVAPAEIPEAARVAPAPQQLVLQELDLRFGDKLVPGNRRAPLASRSMWWD